MKYIIDFFVTLPEEFAFNNVKLKEGDIVDFNKAFLRKYNSKRSLWSNSNDPNAFQTFFKVVFGEDFLSTRIKDLYLLNTEQLLNILNCSIADIYGFNPEKNDPEFAVFKEILRLKKLLNKYCLTNRPVYVSVKHLNIDQQLKVG